MSRGIVRHMMPRRCPAPKRPLTQRRGGAVSNKAERSRSISIWLRAEKIAVRGAQQAISKRHNELTV